jgi:hypothetical protein
MSKKKTNGKELIYNMINKIDIISYHCKDAMIIIKLAKFQQQLYKITALNKYDAQAIDLKIDQVIDDIIKLVMKNKNSDSMENLLSSSLTNLINLMDTRIALEHVDD